jgi:hypothetical protein
MTRHGRQWIGLTAIVLIPSGVSLGAGDPAAVRSQIAAGPHVPAVQAAPVTSGLKFSLFTEADQRRMRLRTALFTEADQKQKVVRTALFTEADQKRMTIHSAVWAPQGATLEFAPRSAVVSRGR